MLVPPDESCYEGAPPAGPRCSCRFTDCAGHDVHCTCDPECYETRDDCLIVVNDGSASSADPLLSTCQIQCEVVEDDQQDEFQTPTQMECDATGCGTPPEVPEGPDPSPDPGDAGEPPPEPTEGCPVPVPSATVLSGPVWGEYDVQFYVPHPSWAFATAHAWKWLQRLGEDGIDLRLSPSFFFATALKESYMGCSDILPEPDPYSPGMLARRYNAYADGCLQIESTTAWTEMCRMYPEAFDCDAVGHDDVISSSNQSVTGRDNFASSVLIAAYYNVFTYAMIANVHGVGDPDGWFAAASDPLAMEKVTALLFNTGAWSGDVTIAMQGCWGDLIENCIGNQDYVIAVSSYTRELEAAVGEGVCYHEGVTEEDVVDYVRRITPLFTRENEAALIAAARAAFQQASGGAASADFQKVAMAVLEAIDGEMTVELRCPAEQLSAYYGGHCPS